MKIGSLLILTAKSVRKGLVNMSIDKNPRFNDMVQIYQCRILGLCITRDLESDRELLFSIKKEAEIKTYLKTYGLDDKKEYVK